MKLRATCFLPILLLFAFVCTSAHADSWMTPQIQLDALSPSTVEIVVAEPPVETKPGEPVCNAAEAKFEIADATRISSQQLRDKAKSLLRPGYPPMARAKHIEGQVIVEVLVSKTGDVICARTLIGDPLLREASLKVAKKWKFEPFATTADATEVVSTLAVDFKLR
jgi:TonB family protein